MTAAYISVPTLPLPNALDSTLAEVLDAHGVAAYLIMNLSGVHALAAIEDHFALRGATLLRITLLVPYRPFDGGV